MKEGTIMFIRPTWAEIHLDRITHNMAAFQKILPAGVQTMAVVKADGYGHGVVPIARAALQGGADFLGVASVDEAIPLRQAEIDAPILVLGYTPVRSLPWIARYNLRATVFDIPTLEALNDIGQAQGKPLAVHVKVDTGMGRLGVNWNQEALAFLRKATSLPGIRVEGIFSHFATADAADKSFARLQIERWLSLLQNLEKEGIEIPVQHIANSAGVIDLPESVFSMVRIGIGLYGYYPSDQVRKERVHLLPALRFVSEIAMLKDVPAGTPISYGGTYITQKRERIATVPVGYGDGYSRSLSNKAYALVHGRRVPVVGRVCMDQLHLVVSDVPDVKVGDEVVLYGTQGRESVSIEEIAAIAGTISYEVICNIGTRVPRLYFQNGKIVEAVHPMLTGATEHYI
jgi:alanine racemase